MDKCICHLNGYAIKDAQARKDIETLKESLANGMNYKGNVESLDELEGIDVEVGDMYNVTLTGVNYVWNGSDWDALSSPGSTPGSSEGSSTPTKVFYMSDDLDDGQEWSRIENPNEYTINEGDLLISPTNKIYCVTETINKDPSDDDYWGQPSNCRLISSPQWEKPCWEYFQSVYSTTANLGGNYSKYIYNIVFQSSNGLMEMIVSGNLLLNGHAMEGSQSGFTYNSKEYKLTATSFTNGCTIKITEGTSTCNILGVYRQRFEGYNLWGE